MPSKGQRQHVKYLHEHITVLDIPYTLSSVYLDGEDCTAGTRETCF
jgi:hypothetical protein